MDPSDPMMLLWPWWKTKVGEAGGCEQTDATKYPPRNVPILPLDVIDIILREACEWRHGREGRQVLTACTLVCKSWLPLSQRLLYRSVIVETGHANTSRSPGRFGTEALLQRSHLLRYTRSLSILVRGKSPVLPLLLEDDSLKGSQKRVLIPDFFFLLAHTPNIQHLNLFLSSAGRNRDIGEPHIHWLDWLSSLALPIEALSISDGKIFVPRPTFVFDLVGIWPTIRALRLTTSRINVELPPERPSIRLRELCLQFISDPKMATIILKWSLPPPHPNEQSYLRFLELEIIPEEARAVLSVHGPSVSTLTLYHQPRFEIDSLFTNLEELVIANPVWSSPLPAFPRTLKHIKVITGPFMPLDHVIALVAQVVPTLPNLRVISVEARFAANKHYLDLQEACQTQGVEILVHSSSVHPYHIEMGRFPRQYTFSEFFDVGDCRL